MNRILNALPIIVGIVYVTVLNIFNFRPAVARPLSLAGLFLMGLVVFFLKKRGSLSPIHKGFLVYMVFNVMASWGLPIISTNPGWNNPLAFLYLALSAVVVLPVLFQKQYFTEYFARQSTPPAVWETSVFKKINSHLTWIWAGIFAACFILTLVPNFFSLEGDRLTALIFGMVLPLFLMLGVGVPLNNKYPQYVQRKMGIKLNDSIIPPNRKEERMEKTLQVVALNSSPHLGIGNTSLMIQMIKAVLSEKGIDLEEIFLADKRIEFCIGCGVCLEKGKCWRLDDQAEIIEKLLSADGIILASPVYFSHVTAQMKTFIDRSLAYSHKPRQTRKPGLAISVSAGLGECSTADYLSNLLKIYGAFSIGTFTALAVSPGGFLGKDLVEARARDLAGDLARAIKEKRRYPVTEKDLSSYLFMRDLVDRQKDFMQDDYRHWQESGFLEGFEDFIKQQFIKPDFDPEVRKAWLREMIRNETAGVKDRAAKDDSPKSSSVPGGPQSANNCWELLKMMPLGFNAEAAGGLKAVYQFEISGSESFVAHLTISGGKCQFFEGSDPKPDVVVKSPAEVWLAVSKGEMDGQTAFMTGKYQVQGDLGLLLKMKALFSR